MSVSMSHIFEQGPVLGALARTALRAAQARPTAPLVAPGTEIVETLPPRSAELVRDYVRHVGGDSSSYRATLPPHLFPQWAFPLAARTIEDAPYPLLKVLNGGCRLESLAPLPAGRPLRVTARLAHVDDNGERVILDQEITTGTAEVPAAVRAHIYAFVPLGGGGDKRDQKPRSKPKAQVPDDAREIAYWRIGANAGLDFAKLTGDFNPVHWLAPYARAMGFRSTILHGFSTLARAWEGLARGLHAGDPSAIAMMDVRFTRPLVLPGRLGLYVASGGRVYVGDAPGAPAYLEGTYQSRA